MIIAEDKDDIHYVTRTLDERYEKRTITEETKVKCMRAGGSAEMRSSVYKAGEGVIADDDREKYFKVRRAIK